MIHSARPPATSRSSFISSGRNGEVRPYFSRERKENVLQAGIGETGARPQLLVRSAAAHAPLRQEKKAVADAFGIRQLMDREHERAALPGLGAQDAHDVAG